MCPHGFPPPPGSPWPPRRPNALNFLPGRSFCPLGWVLCGEPPSSLVGPLPLLPAPLPPLTLSLRGLHYSPCFKRQQQRGSSGHSPLTGRRGTDGKLRPAERSEEPPLGPDAWPPHAQGARASGLRIPGAPPSPHTHTDPAPRSPPLSGSQRLSGPRSSTRVPKSPLLLDSQPARGLPNLQMPPFQLPTFHSDPGTPQGNRGRPSSAPPGGQKGSGAGV